ncbi:hypothetical protein [Salidesulfovibrio onnuriiensis]|uniref:hypothetical protein n=1 Tax=Salidesulfovibrio onnuriiensis TaxID=2583823 RepID=UPI0011C93396|nr:hypothetical protein [Salidesulfovibrio onnuriiensis]
MKTVLATLLALFLCAGTTLAHTLFMTVTDNEDGTVTVEGMYSTGTAASDTELRLEGPNGRVLFQGRTDADGELEFAKPASPYTIILDGGPGHVATEEGPR